MHYMAHIAWKMVVGKRNSCASVNSFPYGINRTSHALLQIKMNCDDRTIKWIGDYLNMAPREN